MQGKICFMGYQQSPYFFSAFRISQLGELNKASAFPGEIAKSNFQCLPQPYFLKVLLALRFCFVFFFTLHVAFHCMLL